MYENVRVLGIDTIKSLCISAEEYTYWNTFTLAFWAIIDLIMRWDEGENFILIIYFILMTFTCKYDSQILWKSVYFSHRDMSQVSTFGRIS